MSRASSDDVDAQTLQERVAELERVIETHELADPLEMAAYRQLVWRLAGYESGEEAPESPIEVVKDAAHRLDQLEAAVAENERAASNALGIASAVAQDDESDGKKAYAKRLSRNELVRREAQKRQIDAASSLEAGDVQEMAKPDMRLYYQSIKDAWRDLEETWDAIDVVDEEAGPRKLTIDRAAITRELVARVETSLERDDLTKKLISGNSQPEGSA